MDQDEILLDTEDRMEKAAAVFKNALTGLRTGRANPGLVDSIRVNYYGSPTPLKQLAVISCPEPQQIVIKPFDGVKDGLAVFSGATILGDGVPALILDVSSLL